jgi:carbon-monoxide dehydrogenase medium subunit
MSPAYRVPDSLDEAVALIGEHGPAATVLAGGVTFASMMAARRSNSDLPRLVVSLGRLSELRGIRAQSDGLWIGAMTTHREVERSRVVRLSHPVLADTFARIGSVRIRNQATLGGNLACGDPTFDPPVTLIALDANVVVAGAGGAHREIPLDRFVCGQDSSSLGSADIIVGVRVPTGPPGRRAWHMKVRARSAGGKPTVTVAAAVQLDADGRIDDVRLALGAVAPTVIRARRTEAALRGRRPTPDVVRDASALVAEEIDPITDSRGSISYKRQMARVWVARALAAVSTQADPAPKSGPGTDTR